MKFAQGEDVLVKLPGAGLTVSATIVSRQKGGDYIVKYDGGLEQEISERHIKQSTIERSPPVSPSRRGRRASPARNRSPARQKSPARVKKSSPSPSRRSPSRRSPSRIVKLSTEKTEELPKNLSFPRRRKPIEHTEMSETSSFHTVTETSFDDLNGSNKFRMEGISEFTLSKEIMQTNVENDVKIMHLKPGYELNCSEIFNEITKPDSQTRPSVPSKEFGGWFGTLFMMLLFPVMMVALNISCNRKFCSWSWLVPLDKYKQIGTYFDFEATILYISYVTLMAFFSVLPFGGPVVSSQPNKYMKQEYRMNGFFSMFALFTVIALLEYLHIPILTMIYDKYFQLCITALCFGLAVSTAMYIHSYYVPVSALNTHAVTGNYIYDFYMGREIHPKIFGVYAKLVMLRCTIIGTILINLVFISKGLVINYGSPKPEINQMVHFESFKIDPTLLTAALIIILYMLDTIVFESTLTTTFEFKDEGFGYMLAMGYAVYPFMLTTITKFVLEHKVMFNVWQLVAVWVVFLTGLFLYRASNSQKHKFRVNPYDPNIAYLESIPTAQGKKLLVSGYWGMVRHPNYVGDILMHLCFYSLVPCVPPAITALTSVFLILYRISRVGTRCNARYGSAWNRYCQRVKYNLIPKLF